MKKLTAISFFLLYAGQAHALKYVIFTDQPGGKKAQDVVEMMKTTYPFSAHDVEFEIVQATPAQLNCASKTKDSSGKIIKRAVTCEGTDGLQSWAARKGGDQAMVIKDLDYHGGTSSTGGVPVMTTGSHPRVMLHEYMHTLGLCDEYEFKASEANIYCANIKDDPNATVFEPRSSYSSDGEARRIHDGDIPWYGSILPSTLITTGSSLGTGETRKEKEAPNNTNIPAALGEPIGLYKGRVCKNASPAKTSWLPGGKITVMEDYEAGLGPYMEKKVEKILFSKGSERKMEPVERRVELPDRSDGQMGELEVVDGAYPNGDTSVDDSPRNFFKDLFEAIGNLFKSIFQGITR